MMLVETLTEEQLNATDGYLNSIDPGFSKKFWIGVLNKNAAYVWITSNTPLLVSKNSLPASTANNCVFRNNSGGGPWVNGDCATTYAYAFCQQGKFPDF